MDLLLCEVLLAATSTEWHCVWMRRVHAKFSHMINVATLQLLFFNLSQEQCLWPGVLSTMVSPSPHFKSMLLLLDKGDAYSPITTKD